jgi:hypothetical protein
MSSGKINSCYLADRFALLIGLMLKVWETRSKGIITLNQGVFKLFMAKGHIGQCGLIRGPSTNKQQ